MTNNTPKTASVFSRQKRAAIFLAVLALFVLTSAGSCSAYVAPDWAAQARNNARQQVHSKPVTVNLKKQLRDNKRQKAHGKKVKVDKSKEKKNNARQKSKSKPYKYDRKAELRLNARQKVM